MNILSPVLYTDGYKMGHHLQYPKKTTWVYSNMTPRGSRIPGVNKIVFFGLQYFMEEYLIRQWEEGFFSQPKKKVIEKYKRRVDMYLGKDAVSVGHIEKLHDLGALPVRICAMPEGSLVDMRVPVLTIESTMDEMFWVTNYLETLMSCSLWSMCTSATIAHTYKLLLNKYADETVGNRNHIPWQAHDFSMRGMSSLESACMSAAGHLLSFYGSDTVPAIDFIEEYYGKNPENMVIANSVAASEHAVMCAGTKEKEFQTFEYLMDVSHPKGILSIVSDTYDYWNVLTNFLPKLKDKIMKRDGKIVIRPDSGDPIKIICGDPSAPADSAENKGSVQILWEIFGGNKRNKKGYKELDPHIGLIYGDSITLERATAILEGLKKKKFASNNIVFGVGSYTYQYNTRDTFGFAHKATCCKVNGKMVPIFKDPKTDDGTKKSAKGLLEVLQKTDLLSDGYILKENVEHIDNSMLYEVFCNGRIGKRFSFSDVREKLEAHYAE